ncbi:hypothetical protein [Mycoplasma elephantis]|uniref:hypothetical protein n=1 Tax=Mycoplasma elephantis TaxID=114882 RepID=UPI00048414CD|nr:hypothetical protein [Mycoplasma elephantis]
MSEGKQKLKMSIGGSLTVLIFLVLFLAPIIYWFFVNFSNTFLGKLPETEINTINILALDELPSMTKKFNEIIDSIKNAASADVTTCILMSLGFCLGLLAIVFLAWYVILFLIKIIFGFFKNRWLGAPLLLLGWLLMISFFVILILNFTGKINYSDGVLWFLKLSVPISFGLNFTGLIFCKAGI